MATNKLSKLKSNVMIQYENTLVWPDNVPHNKVRKKSLSKSTWLTAKAELQSAVKASGITNVIITSNSNIVCDVWHSHRSGAFGVSVLYNARGKRRIMWCDTYFKECDNLRAIADTIRKFHDINKKRVRFQVYEPLKK